MIDPPLKKFFFFKGERSVYMRDPNIFREFNLEEEAHIDEVVHVLEELEHWSTSPLKEKIECRLRE